MNIQVCELIIWCYIFSSILKAVSASVGLTTQEEMILYLVFVSFLLFRFCINLIFFRSVYITVGSECVHHHIVKMQSSKDTNA